MFKARYVDRSAERIVSTNVEKICRVSSMGNVVFGEVEQIQLALDEI